MSPHQTVAIAIRLFVIWLAIHIASRVPAAWLQISEYDDTSIMAIAIGVSIVIVIFLAALWFFPRSVAKTLLPGPDVAEQPSTDPDRWFMVGVSLIGLWLIAGAIPAIFRYASLFMLSRRTEQFVINSEFYAGVVYYVVQLVIGIWLFVGTKGLKQILLKIRGRD